MGKNVDIEQWVSEYGELSSSVQCALVKTGSYDSMFKHLYSGNRFCYVKSFHKAIPRYVIYNMPDAVQVNNLNPGFIDLKIVVYHEGQDINYSSCLADDHQVQKCPVRQNERRDSPRCSCCNEIGYIARNCEYENKNEQTNNSTAERVVENEKNNP